MSCRKREFVIGILLLLVSGILFALSPEKVSAAFRENTALILRVALIAVVAVVISTAVHLWVPRDFVQRILSRRSGLLLFLAPALGILTPGPVYAIYPVILVLKKKGVRTHVLVAYLTGQALIGPARIPFELGLLGGRFLLFRVVLSFFLGVLAGLLYAGLSKILADPVPLDDPE